MSQLRTERLGRSLSFATEVRLGALYLWFVRLRRLYVRKALRSGRSLKGTDRRGMTRSGTSLRSNSQLRLRARPGHSGSPDTVPEDLLKPTEGDFALIDIAAFKLAGRDWTTVEEPLFPIAVRAHFQLSDGVFPGDRVVYVRGDTVSHQTL